MCPGYVHGCVCAVCYCTKYKNPLENEKCRQLCDFIAKNTHLPQSAPTTNKTIQISLKISHPFELLELIFENASQLAQFSFGASLWTLNLNKEIEIFSSPFFRGNCSLYDDPNEVKTRKHSIWYVNQSHLISSMFTVLTEKFFVFICKSRIVLKLINTYAFAIVEQQYTEFDTWFTK